MDSHDSKVGIPIAVVEVVVVVAMNISEDSEFRMTFGRGSRTPAVVMGC